MQDLTNATSVAESQQPCNNSDQSETAVQSSTSQPSSADAAVADHRKIRLFDDPHNFAEDFIRTHASFKEHLMLHYWRERFYWWKWDHYEECADYEMSGKVATFMRRELDKISRKFPDKKTLKRAVMP